ncbi:hypothetical protein [Streptomyces shenzhenensis]|uniref:Uncharacterized protein n=1 Tax=Streptomyces shenzhenensis TaxID=943815 RepID=A0A3M0I361_9ACTN|nr:hypothetical protein [Streptomyces shenzhenensis]RMB82610.1 hypothetical protein CTZ28_28030 [Streptomyces shenzhenensis]
MDQSEDQILADELAALGAVGGGSGRLVRLVAMLMRKNVHEIDLVIPLPFNDAAERVSRVLNQIGRAVETTQVGPGRDEEAIRVVASGGTGGMNPVAVTALVSHAGENSSEVRLRAAAKEGLIKQQAGEKTAIRVAALLRKASR